MVTTSPDNILSLTDHLTSDRIGKTIKREAVTILWKIANDAEEADTRSLFIDQADEIERSIDE